MSARVIDDGRVMDMFDAHVEAPTVSRSPIIRQRRAAKVVRTRRVTGDTCARLGVSCGKPPVFMPMRAIEPRPFPPAACARAKG